MVLNQLLLKLGEVGDDLFAALILCVVQNILKVLFEGLGDFEDELADGSRLFTF